MNIKIKRKFFELRGYEIFSSVDEIISLQEYGNGNFKYFDS
jgi:hypothetical protein